LLLLIFVASVAPESPFFVLLGITGITDQTPSSTFLDSPDARNSLKDLVAGGGFVPQSYIDSVQLADFTIVPNAKKGYKGKSFIQFSFSLCFQRSTRILAAV
jgi:hypothetical protein